MSGYPLRKGELVQSETNEGWTIYVPETDSLHILNQSARALWELCDGQTALEEMAEALADLTQLDRASATREVSEALQNLREAGLIRFDD